MRSNTRSAAGSAVLAVEKGTSILVEDVYAFPGHIACDAASRSELVVPLQHNGKILGVIDLDSPTASRFDAADQAGVEALAWIFVEASCIAPAWPLKLRASEFRSRRLSGKTGRACADRPFVVFKQQA